MNEVWGSVVSSIRKLTEPYESVFCNVLKDCLPRKSFFHRPIDQSIERLGLLGNNSCVDGEFCLELADEEYKLFGSENTKPQSKLQATGRKVNTDSKSNAAMTKALLHKLEEQFEAQFASSAGVATFAHEVSVVNLLVDPCCACRQRQDRRCPSIVRANRTPRLFCNAKTVMVGR